MDFSCNSGACCTSIITRDIETGETEDVNLVSVNRDVYDVFAEHDMKYVKYFVIAHELGHCFNGDCFRNHDRKIRNEIKADLRGYEFMESGWFGEFKFNTDLIMCPKVRRMQHILNCLMMHFGRKTPITSSKSTSQVILGITSNSFKNSGRMTSVINIKVKKISSEEKRLRNTLIVEIKKGRL